MAKKNGHHGGAWKIAYADFMTAMMAFFLLLWLLSFSEDEDEKLKGVADYFRPSEVTLTNIGGQGVMKGSSPAEDDLLGESIPAAESEENVKNDLSPSGKDSPNDESSENAAMVSGDSAVGAENPWSRFVTEASAAETEGAVASLTDDIRARLNPFGQNVRVHEKNGNVLIDLIDLSSSPMFDPGSDRLSGANMGLVREIAEILASVGGRIIITGHTDTVQYADGADYSNWELSADRANAMRRAIVSSGVDGARVSRVSGVADTQPMEGVEPSAPENRRISIEISTAL